MIKNYIKIGWRNIRKNWILSSINIFGLSIGIAFTFLIGAYVWNELKVNKELRNAENQYIIQSKWKDPNMGYEIATLAPIPKALKEEYPTLVANYYRCDAITTNVANGNVSFREGLQIGDSTLLTMFGFSLIHGDRKTALTQPFSVVITEERAKKYFGRTEVVGQSLSLASFSGTKHDFMITGVMKNPPDNSVTHLNDDNDNQIYVSGNAASYFGRDFEGWTTNIFGYIELQKGVRLTDLQKPIQQLITRNAYSQISENLTPYLMPLKKYYLEKDDGLVKKMLYTVSFIALFILVMASINFINITVSKSSTRIREIGIRKVLGGLRKQLLLQFLIESLILVLFSTVIALGIYYVANPFISDILNKQIPQLTSFPIYFYLIPVLIIIVIGCIAGIYPATVLSALKAVDSIKGKLKTVKENILLRKTFLTFQFSTALLVLIGGIIVSRQITLFFGDNIGYSKDLLVSAQVPRDWSSQGVKRMETIRNEFASMPEIKAVSLSYQIPDGGSPVNLPLFVQGKDSTQAVSVQVLVSDENYLRTYEIPLKAGRFFGQPSDSINLVINETAAKSLGWTDINQAVGRQLILPGGFPITIIGVIKDYHHSSMKGKIQPAAFMHVELSKVYRFLSFKLTAGNISKSIEALQKKWSSLFPGIAFEYKFMDETLKQLYQKEIQLKKASQTATGLALFIVVLGIIALVSLSIQKRTKEIGVRKVLGASHLNVLYLFLKEFLLLILLSGIISVPLAYYIMQGWLDDYSYRVSITAQPFLISIIALGFLTAVLIAIQISKMILQNPVKNLRTE